MEKCQVRKYEEVTIDMTKQNQHVVTHNGDWAVRGEGNGRVTSIHDT